MQKLVVHNNTHIGTYHKIQILIHSEPNKPRTNNAGEQMRKRDLERNSLNIHHQIRRVKETPRAREETKLLNIQ